MQKTIVLPTDPGDIKRTLDKDIAEGWRAPVGQMTPGSVVVLDKEDRTESVRSGKRILHD